MSEWINERKKNVGTKKIYLHFTQALQNNNINNQ